MSFPHGAIGWFVSLCHFHLFSRQICSLNTHCDDAVFILTSTKNASLIITDFLAMIYKNEQPPTASLCRGWAMLKNDLNLICR